MLLFYFFLDMLIFEPLKIEILSIIIKYDISNNDNQTNIGLS
jgi:hypothetical protein